MRPRRWVTYEWTPGLPHPMVGRGRFAAEDRRWFWLYRQTS